MVDIVQAFKTIEQFSTLDNLTKRISTFEKDLAEKEKSQIQDILLGVNIPVLSAALTIKNAVGQINVLIHALGILVASLPYILEPGEVIQSLSLGAGNTGRGFDLETDRRVAEFKFIKWQESGRNTIRQNNLFIDLFNLVEHEQERRRYLYVTGKDIPLSFLEKNRDLKSVLSKNRAVSDEFFEKHHDKYRVVSDYYKEVKGLVHIVDLNDFADLKGLF